MNVNVYPFHKGEVQRGRVKNSLKLKRFCYLLSFYTNVILLLVFCSTKTVFLLFKDTSPSVNTPSLFYNYTRTYYFPLSPSLNSV